MNLPTYTRTKREALALAADIFPDHAAAMARLDAEDRARPYPHFWLEGQIRDDLRQLFDWLFDDRTRIYKRARWHLFYDLAKRLVDLIAANRADFDRRWRLEQAGQEWHRRLASWTMTGDGEGI